MPRSRPEIIIVQCPIILNECFRQHACFIKWKHFPRYWSFVRGLHRTLVDSPHKGQWRGVLVFSLIRAWTNGWVNNRDAVDLRRHRTHWDVAVMRHARDLTIQQPSELGRRINTMSFHKRFMSSWYKSCKIPFSNSWKIMRDHVKIFATRLPLERMIPCKITTKSNSTVNYKCGIYGISTWS